MKERNNYMYQLTSVLKKKIATVLLSLMLDSWIIVSRSGFYQLCHFMTVYKSCYNCSVLAIAPIFRFSVMRAKNLNLSLRRSTLRVIESRFSVEVIDANNTIKFQNIGTCSFKGFKLWKLATQRDLEATLINHLEPKVDWLKKAIYRSGPSAK